MRIRDFLRDAGIADLAAYQIELAIVEVITNVVRHGCSERHDLPITVNIVLTAKYVRATIEDPGTPPPMQPGGGLKDPLAESGRGIDIVYSVMDEVHHRAVRGRNVVELTKRVDCPERCENNS